MKPRIAILITLLVANLCPGQAERLSPPQIQAAQKLYTAKCAKCHKFYDPAAYSQAEWDLWMLKMKKKSKLKTDQFELLSRYLNAVRSDKEQGLNGR